MSSSINPPPDREETRFMPTAGGDRYGDDRYQGDSRYEGDRDTSRMRPVGSDPTPYAGSEAVGLTRQDVVARQKERFGKMKFGACFFGWLTASGAAVLLTALVAGVSVGTGVTPQEAAGGNAQNGGLLAGIVGLVIILIAYFCGGYVASRMARFSGVKQGIGVWLWALIAAVVVAVLGFIVGDSLNALTRLNGVPAVPGVSQQALTTGGIITALAVALIALIGAILGGLAGLRYHRRVDKEGFQH